MALEEQVEAGRAAYIKRLDYDADGKTLRISFMRADTWVVYGTLTFTDVQDYCSQFDTEEDRMEFMAGALIEGLIGISEMGEGVDPNHSIRTDAREITFSTSALPNWSCVEMCIDVAQ